MNLKFCALWLGLTVLGLGIAPAEVRSQVTSDNSTPTTVSTTGSQINITGGRSVGTNLFHGFATFSPREQTAQFGLTPDQSTIQNVFARVSSNNPSVINGILRVQGGNNPSLYLMNPAGILFGAGASLNIPGSFVATTANGIRFSSNGWFNAVGSNNYDNGTLAGTPNAIAFTMSNPGAIVNAGNLTVNSGQSIVLAGGTVISTGTFNAPGGRITIAASPGNSVTLVQQGSLLSLSFPRSPEDSAIEISRARSQVNALSLTFTPVSIPQLITGGSNIGGATGVTVENGVVRLTGSDITLSAEASDQIGVYNNGSIAGNLDLITFSSPAKISGNLDISRNLTSTQSLEITGRNGENIRIGGDLRVGLLAVEGKEPEVNRSLRVRTPGFTSVQGLIKVDDTIDIESGQGIRTNAIESGAVVRLVSAGDISVASINLGDSFDNAFGRVARLRNVSEIFIKTSGIFQARGIIGRSTGDGTLSIEVSIDGTDAESVNIKNFLISQGILSSDGRTINQERNQLDTGEIIVSSQRTVRILPTGKSSPPASLTVSALVTNPKVTIEHGGLSIPSSSDFVTVTGTNINRKAFLIPSIQSLPVSEFNLSRATSLNPDGRSFSFAAIETRRVSPLAFGSTQFPVDQSGLSGVILQVDFSNIKIGRYFSAIPSIPKPDVPQTDLTKNPTNSGNAGTVITSDRTSSDSQTTDGKDSNSQTDQEDKSSDPDRASKPNETGNCNDKSKPCKKKPRSILQIDPRLLNPTAK
ncbi:hypothetical protein LEP3755_12290 [Leptolyngbya sp. NIES-3755]|nr:hypothetical protein LEP3755_12290 [Leptolyngbya sp. NIES-3755]